MYGTESLPKSLQEDWQGGKIYYHASCGGFTIEDLRQNCSLLCFTNYVLFPGKEKQFCSGMRVALRWAKENGGYTKVFSTMSITNKRAPIHDLLLKIGFTSVGRRYKNKRTGNTICWLQGDIDKMLENLKELCKK
jgi:hypothetical protein